MGAYNSYARCTCLFSSTTSTWSLPKAKVGGGIVSVRVARVSYPLERGIAKGVRSDEESHQQRREAQEREEAEHVGERGDDHARRDGGIDAEDLQRDRHQRADDRGDEHVQEQGQAEHE